MVKGKTTRVLACVVFFCFLSDIRAGAKANTSNQNRSKEKGGEGWLLSLPPPPLPFYPTHPIFFMLVFAPCPRLTSFALRISGTRKDCYACYKRSSLVFFFDFNAFFCCNIFVFGVGCLIAGFLLMTEMATPEWRRWANCLSQGAYGVGIAVQALIAYYVRGWKAFSLVITLLNLPFVALYW